MSSSKRVTFIYRNYEGLGVGYLASYVRSLGHKVQLVLYPDPWSDTYVKQKDKDSPMTGRLQSRVNRQLTQEVVDFRPDLLCFSMRDSKAPSKFPVQKIVRFPFWRPV